MSRPEWLFFDVGSTLVDESECYRVRIMETTAGTGITPEEFYRRMIEQYRLGCKGDKVAAARFGLRLSEWRSEYERLYPQTVGCLERLRNHYRMGVIANQNPGLAKRLDHFGILRFFDVVASSAEEGFSKPDPRLFVRALSLAGCAPGNAVMIGDRPDNDIAPAGRLGMKTVRIMQGLAKYAPPSCPEEIPDFTADDLDGLCRLLRLKEDK